MKTILTLSILFVSFAAFGQQLVYKPVNPAFGGDTFNHQWLLNAANAQNSFTDPSDDAERSDLEEFTDDLNRQLLNQLERSIFSSQLGSGLQEGTFTFGSLELEVFDSGEGLVINILDTSTGEQTQIIVPNN